MSSSDDNDALPLILAGVILLIMSMAVVMYPSSAGPAAPRDHSARSHDSRVALSSASPRAGADASDPRVDTNAPDRDTDTTSADLTPNTKPSPRL